MANETIIQLDIVEKHVAIIVAVIILCALAIIAVEHDRPYTVYNVTYVTDNYTPENFFCYYDNPYANESNHSWEPLY